VILRSQEVILRPQEAILRPQEEALGSQSQKAVLRPPEKIVDPIAPLAFVKTLNFPPNFGKNSPQNRRFYGTDPAPLETIEAASTRREVSP
jgi:hypothetical protein